ncbi:MAG TPA: Aspartate-semialdehyde dehydrogenase 2 [Hyphomicrobiaceae bacterium MAG_BT-2024]
MGYNIAIVGATGAVGREMLNVLAFRKFPVNEVYAIASRRSLGREVSFGRTKLKCYDLETFDFKNCDIALMSAGSSVAKIFAPKIGRTGCLVIDNSSAWRYDINIPLIVPEVNAHVLQSYMTKGDYKNIIANPNCSTIQLLVSLKPLHNEADIRKITVSTYQSVSGAGQKGMDELWHQTKGKYVPGQEVSAHKFTKEIAFNVIPHIDEFMEDGYTKEEWKMAAETKKILDPNIKLTATCVRVPVFVGHAEAVNIEFNAPITAANARSILRKSPGVLVIDKRKDGGYATPLECAGEYATYVSRIREDITTENGLSMWIVSDNLLKGAALNAIQIAETVIDQGLAPRKPSSQK